MKVINFIKAVANYIRLEEQLIPVLKQADMRYPQLKQDMPYNEQARGLIRAYKKRGYINNHYELTKPIIA